MITIESTIDLTINYSTINQFDWFIFVFCVSNSFTSFFAIIHNIINFFFVKRINHIWESFLSFFDVKLKEWIIFVNLIFKSFIFSLKVKHKILVLLYKYRYFNEKNLINLSFTNLMIYRVRIKSRIKSILIKYQKRWFIHIE